jgi:hypothetical protein
MLAPAHIHLLHDIEREARPRTGHPVRRALRRIVPGGLAVCAESLLTKTGEARLSKMQGYGRLSTMIDCLPQGHGQRIDQPD